MLTAMSWRPEDEALLLRLEDERVAEALTSFFVRGDETQEARRETLPPRASGLVALLRRIPNGADAVRAAVRDDVGRLAAFVTDLELSTAPPELLHHLALFHANVA